MTFSKFLSSIFKPSAWRRQFKRTRLNYLKAKMWKDLNGAFSSSLALQTSHHGEAVLAEGMWDNPNQYYRLRIFLEAIPQEHRHVLAAVVWNRKSRAISTMKSLGFSKFFFLEDCPIIPSDRESAKLLSEHKELSSLRLPSGMPGYVVYDTVLKNTRLPKVDLSGDLWIEALADAIRMDRFYCEVLKELDLSAVVYSHPWKTEFGTIAWRSISARVPFYHLNGMYETMRIRKIASEADFRSPVETCTYDEFSKLTEVDKDKLRIVGSDYLSQRGRTSNTDINEQLAFSGIKSSEKLRDQLNISKEKHVCLICAHAWFDFPHAFGMQNFTDFVDWLEVTLSIISARPDIIWLFKPHPAEPWYGGAKLADFVRGRGSHIKLLEEAVSTDAAQDLADSVVTVHGTVGMEAAARGKVVLCADNNPYASWGISVTACSRSDYKQKLSIIDVIPAPSEAKARDAAACMYLNVAPLDAGIGMLQLVGDHADPETIFGNLHALCESKKDVVRQGLLVRDWINSGTGSFSVFYKLLSTKY